MNAILICVDYDDFLAVTLPANQAHFDRIVVVTDNSDERTAAVASRFPNVTLHRTDAFYAAGAAFNKGAALEEGFDVLGREGWICVLDADILLPRIFDLPPLAEGWLYGARRRMLKRAEDYSRGIDWRTLPLRYEELAGYFQLFHADDPRLAQRPWYPADWLYAGGCDTVFQMRWPLDRQRWLAFEVLHLGPCAMNWARRVTARIDSGERPPEAAARQAQLSRVFALRKEHDFSHEMLPAVDAAPSVAAAPAIIDGAQAISARPDPMRPDPMHPDPMHPGPMRPDPMDPGPVRPGPPPRVAVSLCMIVRDNAATLDAALASAKPWVDEMVVVDTGSLDDTPEIARRHGARVFQFAWCDDFSAARNESVRHARGEWIFWMDSDDTLDAACGQKLRALADQAAQPKVMAYVMQVHCPGAEDAGLTVVDHVKMFRNLPELRFDGRIHEQILPAIRRAGGEVAWTDIFVRHSGADVTREGRAAKHARDLRLLKLELQERPDHPFTLFNLGMTCADMRDYDRAADYLCRSILVSPVSDSHVRKAYALLLSSLTELGRLPAAWEPCEKALALFPKDAELLFRRGILAHRCGLLEEAQRAYLAALAGGEERHFSSLDPAVSGFKGRHNLAVVYVDMNRLADAEKQWRQVVQEAPDFAPGWRGLLEVLTRQGQHTLVAEEAARLMSSRDFEIEALLAFANVSASAGRLEESRKLLEQALEEFPAELESLRRLCQLLFEHGTPAQAEWGLRRLLARDPHDASALRNLGTVLLQSNRLAESSAAYRVSLQLRPHSAATYQNLAFALERLGKNDEAREAFASAERLTPPRGQQRLSAAVCATWG